MAEAAESDAKATILAPKVLFYDLRGVINSCGTSMDWLRLRPRIGLCGQKDAGQCERKEAVILPGSALFFKKDLWENAGVFDEDFFLIHEDAELCLRNRRRGFKNLLVPEAVVYHKVSRTLSRFPFLTEYYSIRNFLRLAELQASFFQRVLTAAGLSFLCFRNLLALPFASPVKKQQLKGFFEGVAHYRAKKRGSYGGAS